MSDNTTSGPASPVASGTPVPYYQDDLVTLYHGDMREVLPQLGVGFAHLLIADPPYRIDYQSGRGSHDKIEGDDGSLDIPACLTLAARALARGRHAYIFGPQRALDGTPFTEPASLVWDKQIVGMGDLTQPWGPSHEQITFTTYEPSPANRRKGYGRLAARIRRGSVLSVPRTNGAATLRHPTEKPVPLLRQLIESSSLLGETVIDPMCGVGSTLVAAVLEDRRSIGIESNLGYCDEAVRRLTRRECTCATAEVSR